jgi:hypothetical protein
LKVQAGTPAFVYKIKVFLVLGVGLGELEDNSQPAIIVYFDKTSSIKPQLPAQIEGVAVRVVLTDPFIAY